MSEERHVEITLVPISAGEFDLLEQAARTLSLVRGLGEAMGADSDSAAVLEQANLVWDLSHRRMNSSRVSVSVKEEAA